MVVAVVVVVVVVVIYCAMNRGIWWWVGGDNCGGGGGDILRYESWDVSFVSRLLYNSSLFWSADHVHGDLVVAGIITAYCSASRLD